MPGAQVSNIIGIPSDHDSGATSRSYSEQRRRAASAPATRHVSFAPETDTYASRYQPEDVPNTNATSKVASASDTVGATSSSEMTRKRAHSVSNYGTKSSNRGVSNHELIDVACGELDWSAVRMVLGRSRPYKASLDGGGGCIRSTSGSGSGGRRKSNMQSTPVSLNAAPTRLVSLSDVVTNPTSAGVCAQGLLGTKLSAVNGSISCIDRLPTSVALLCTHLFLSNNDISSLLGIEQFQNIKVVSLSNNRLRRTSDLVQLRSLRYLDKLNLEGNAVTSMPYYRQFLVAICPRLTLLDNVPVSAEERVHSDALSRRAGAVLEALRTEELRASVLRHVLRMTAVNTQLAEAVCGKFSSLRPEHVGDASNASLRHSFDTQLPGGANTSSKGGGSDSGTSRAGGRGDRPSYKHRSTDQTAPPTSTYTTVHSASSPVAFTLHVLMAGGVFRWLQIGCNDDFGRKVESVCQAMYSVVSRSLPAERREKVLKDPDSIHYLWSMLTTLYKQLVTDLCTRLVAECNTALHARAGGLAFTSSSFAGAMPGPDTSAAATSGSSGVGSLYGSADWMALEQFRVIPTAVTTSSSSSGSGSALCNLLDVSSSSSSEWQMTYCGIGPHILWESVRPSSNRCCNYTSSNNSGDSGTGCKEGYPSSGIDINAAPCTSTGPSTATATAGSVCGNISTSGPNAASTNTNKANIKKRADEDGLTDAYDTILDRLVLNTTSVSTSAGSTGSSRGAKNTATGGNRAVINDDPSNTARNANTSTGNGPITGTVDPCGYRGNKLDDAYALATVPSSNNSSSASGIRRHLKGHPSGVDRFRSGDASTFIGAFAAPLNSTATGGGSSSSSSSGTVKTNTSSAAAMVAVSATGRGDFTPASLPPRQRDPEDEPDEEHKEDSRRASADKRDIDDADHDSHATATSVGAKLPGADDSNTLLSALLWGSDRLPIPTTNSAGNNMNTTGDNSARCNNNTKILATSGLTSIASNVGDSISSTAPTNGAGLDHTTHALSASSPIPIEVSGGDGDVSKSTRSAMAELDADVDAISAFLVECSSSSSTNTHGGTDGCANLCSQAWSEAHILDILRTAVRNNKQDPTTRPVSALGTSATGASDIPHSGSDNDTDGSAVLNTIYDALIGPPPPPSVGANTAISTSTHVSNNGSGSGGDGSAAAPDSSKSLKAQFDAATRDLNRLYEDVLMAYTHQQSLQSLCASLHTALTAQAQQAEEVAGSLRDRYRRSADDLDRARAWSRLMAQAREEIQAAMLSNSIRRSDIDQLDGESVALRQAVLEAAQLQSRLAASIDEVCDAAEGLHEDMRSSRDLAAAIRYDHICSLAASYCHSHYETRLLRATLTAWRRLAHYAHRALAGVQYLTGRRHRAYMIGVFGAWVIYASKAKSQRRAAGWIQRRKVAKFLQFWWDAYYCERKLRHGNFLRKNLLSRRALLHLAANAATSRYLCRSEQRIRAVSSYWRCKHVILRWRDWYRRTRIDPKEFERLSAIASGHFKRTLLLGWHRASGSIAATRFSRSVLPCMQMHVHHRLSVAFIGWRRQFSAIQFRRRFTAISALRRMIKFALSQQVMKRSQLIATMQLLRSRVRKYFTYLRRLVVIRRASYLISKRYRNMKLNYVVRAWEFAYLKNKVRVRNERIDSNHQLEMALQLEARAMSHYLLSLLHRAFAAWRSNARLSAMLRLVASAEEQLRAASTDYNQLIMGTGGVCVGSTSGNRLTMASLPDVGIEVEGTSGMKRVISDHLQRVALDDSSYRILSDKIDPSTINSSSSSSITGNRTDNNAVASDVTKSSHIIWKTGCTIVGTDSGSRLAALMDLVPPDVDAQTEKQTLISLGPLRPRRGLQSHHLNTTDITAITTTSTTATANGGTTIVSAPQPDVVVVVREHVHSSHFGPRLRFALKRWRKSTRYNSSLRFLASRLTRKLRISSLRNVWSEMLRQWAAAANRKIAVKDMYLSQKRDATERNVQLKSSLGEHRRNVLESQNILENARDLLALKQDKLRQVEADISLEETLILELSEGIHKSTKEKQDLVAEIDGIVSAYELMVKLPPSNQAASTYLSAALPDILRDESSILSNTATTISVGDTITNNHDFTAIGELQDKDGGSEIGHTYCISLGLDHASATKTDESSAVVALAMQCKALDRQLKSLQQAFFAMSHEQATEEAGYTTAIQAAKTLNARLEVLEAARVQRRNALQSSEKAILKDLAECNTLFLETQQKYSHQLSLTESQLAALQAEARGLTSRLASARTRDGALARKMEALRVAERQAEAQRQNAMAREAAATELQASLFSSSVTNRLPALNKDLVRDSIDSARQVAEAVDILDELQVKAKQFDRAVMGSNMHAPSIVATTPTAVYTPMARGLNSNMLLSKSLTDGLRESISKEIDSLHDQRVADIRALASRPVIPALGVASSSSPTEAAGMSGAAGGGSGADVASPTQDQIDDLVSRIRNRLSGFGSTSSALTSSATSVSASVSAYK